MSDLLAALGLVLVIEGVMSAGFPNMTKNAMLAAAQMPPHKLRVAGLVAVVLGVGLVWLVRG